MAELPLCLSRETDLKEGTYPDTTPVCVSNCIDNVKY